MHQLTFCMLATAITQSNPTQHPISLLQTLSDEVQQHLMTIQQLTEQVQALTSLKRSRSTADQQSSDQQSSDQQSVNDSSTTAIDIDTFPGLEGEGKADDGAVDSIAAITKTGASPRIVGSETQVCSFTLCARLHTLQHKHATRLDSVTTPCDTRSGVMVALPGLCVLDAHSQEGNRREITTPVGSMEPLSVRLWRLRPRRGVQDSSLLSQKSVRWRRALSPRKASLQEDWVLRGLTLHQLKDIITDIYASKAKADAR